MEGLIVFAHGSRVPEANQAVERVARAAAEKGGFEAFEHAFLELAEPTLESAVKALYARGARRIIVAPYFLVMGVHLRQDLPKLIEQVGATCPGVELLVAPPLDGHAGLADILAERAREARGSKGAAAK